MITCISKPNRLDRCLPKAKLDRCQLVTVCFLSKRLTGNAAINISLKERHKVTVARVRWSLPKISLINFQYLFINTNLNHSWWSWAIKVMIITSIYRYIIQMVLKNSFIRFNVYLDFTSDFFLSFSAATAGNCSVEWEKLFVV